MKPKARIKQLEKRVAELEEAQGKRNPVPPAMPDWVPPVPPTRPPHPVPMHTRQDYRTGYGYEGEWWMDLPPKYTLCHPDTCNRGWQGWPNGTVIC